MTALCGGGTSSSRAEFAQFIYVAPAVVGAALNNIETKMAMAIAGAVGGATYDLSVFCTTDPPSMPTITSGDVLAMLNPIQIVDYLAARQKFEDLVRNYLWRQMCKCDSGAQPAIPTAPTAITNFQYNPPSMSPYPGGQACGTYTFNHTIHSGDADFYTDPIPLPDGTTYAVIDSPFIEIAPGAGHTYGAFMQWVLGDGTFENVGPNAQALGTSTFIHHDEGARPSGPATHFRIQFAQFGYTGSAEEMPCTVRLYCGTLPTGGGNAPTPCPPDPLVQALLEQIYGLVQLIQRQSVPFAYVQSTLHSGLSGSGEISVQGLIGCLVTVTAHGSFTGIEAADPDVYFDAGWFSWGNADGHASRTMIDCSPQVSLPPEAGQYTRIAYTLPVGVAISIRELVREP